ncbi:TIGR00282 family metallophosphoesterase [bacterium]|nr:TIGR00282 family metallophosphoesterase [bacterium]
MLKILFFGDVMGSIGRQAIIKALPALKKEYQPDLTTINAENLAHGKGITQKIAQKMKNSGVDFFTSGNHIYSKPDFKKIFADDSFNIIAPANDPRTPLGCGYKTLKIGKNKLIMLNLLGKTFIDEENIECPFKKFNQLYSEFQEINPDYIIIDFHAEATSEKVAFGHYVDGKVTALLGTHTHIQTNDARLLPKGTAYITDVGMVGAKESVIGVNKEIIIDKFLNDSKIIFDIPKTGLAIINAVLLEINEKNSKIKVIKQEIKI